MPNHRIAGWTVDRGRSYELDKTGTGTATIDVNDATGYFDPTNSSGPNYGTLNPLKPAALALQNPVTSAWSTVFRGFVEEYAYDIDPSQKVSRTTVGLVDGMDVLANAEVPPDAAHGDTVYTTPLVDDRINAILDDAGWPSGLRSIFSGNVRLKHGVYSPGTNCLEAIYEAADGEWPGVANFYISKEGDATFHGRLARFNPTLPDYGITTWRCGDGAAVAASISNTAQIRSFKFDRGKDKLINRATATPKGIEDADIAGQTVSDSGSIATYGIRAWSADNLLTDSGILTGNDDLGETRLFSGYYVANFKNPQNRVSEVTFKSLPPTDPRAAALWNLICNVEISDRLYVTVTFPGGGGLSLEPYFIEGIHYDVRPLTTTYHDVTLTLDLSPQAYFSDPAGLDGH